VADLDFKEKLQTRGKRNLDIFLILIDAFSSGFRLQAPFGIASTGMNLWHAEFVYVLEKVL